MPEIARDALRRAQLGAAQSQPGFEKPEQTHGSDDRLVQCILSGGTKPIVQVQSKNDMHEWSQVRQFLTCALLRRRQRVDAIFEVVQANSYRFRLHMPKKLWSTRCRVNQIVPRILTPPLAGHVSLRTAPYTFSLSFVSIPDRVRVVVP